MEVQQVFAPICNVSAINCWCASVCQICQRSVFTHKPRVLQNTLTDTHTPVRSVSTHIWVLLYLLCWRHTHARTCIGSLQKHTDFSLMEHFTGKSLARWGEKHTHTLCMNMELKGRTITALKHWKHLVKHTHAHCSFWGHDSFHSRLQLWISRKPDFTLNFSTQSFSRRRRKTEEECEWEKEKITLNTSVFLAAGEWGDASMWMPTTPPLCLPPPTTASTVFRVYAAYQGAKLWVCMSKYVFYLKATHCHFKTIHCYCLHFATVSLYIFLKYLCVPPWIDMNEFLYHELLFGPQNIMNFFNILLSLHHVSNWSNLAIKTDFVEQNWFLLKLGEIVKIINYFY